MSKIKVLTVQFDVTHLNKAATNTLMAALVAQGEDIDVYDPNAHFTRGTETAEVLNTSVREVDTDDV